MISTGIAHSLRDVSDVMKRFGGEDKIDFECFQRLLRPRGNTRSDLLKLKQHINSAHANTGLGLQSLIGLNRRKLLMSSVLKGARSGLPGVGQNKKLSRKEAAAKSRQVGDNILAHWRVILAAKGDKGSRSFFHGLLPALPTRQEQQRTWKNTLPKLHAETMSLNEMWQKVENWAGPHCRRLGGNKDSSSRSIADEQKDNNSNRTKSREKRESGQAGAGISRRKAIERRLSTYLRPTRADIVRCEKERRTRKKKKKLERKGYRLAVDRQSSSHILRNHIVGIGKEKL